MQQKAAISAGFVVSAVATGLIFWGATAPWISGGSDGITFTVDGQNSGLANLVDVDPVWIFAAAGVSAFGLLVVLLARATAWYFLCVAGALATGIILGVDFSKLLGDEVGIEVSDIGWGAWMTGAAAIALLIGALAGTAQTTWVPVVAQSYAPYQPPTQAYGTPPAQAYGTPPPPSPSAGTPPPPPPPPPPGS